MSEITVPDYDDLILEGLSLKSPAKVNRSKWTGTRKVIGQPGVETWNAKVTIDTIATEEEERPWRAFLFGLGGPANSFRWFLPCNMHIGGKPTVAAGATAGYTLPLAGMAANCLILKAGQFMTVPLPSGKFRAVCLTADLVADGSGNGTATFKPALSEIPALSAVAETGNPFIVLAPVDDELGFGFEQGLSGTSFDVVEAR